MRKSGSFALLQNVSIRTRVFGGFGIVLALLAALAFVAQRALAVVETEASSLTTANQDFGAVDDFALRLGEAHHSVTQAALTETAADRDAARAALGRLATTLAGVRYGNSVEDAAVKSRIEAAQGAYSASVVRMIDAIAQRQLSTQALEKSSTVLKTTVSAIVSALIRENRTEQLQIGLRLQETVQASASAATRFLSSRNPAVPTQPWLNCRGCATMSHSSGPALPTVPASAASSPPWWSRPSSSLTPSRRSSPPPNSFGSPAAIATRRRVNCPDLPTACAIGPGRSSSAPRNRSPEWS
jgi:hypothetical protein